MSDPSLGFASTSQGSHVQVLARRGGGAVIVDLRTLSEIRLDAAQLAELRELLDRAAMPGQRATIPHVVTNLDAHLRRGCPTCLQAEAERRAEAHGAVT